MTQLFARLLVSIAFTAASASLALAQPDMRGNSGQARMTKQACKKFASNASSFYLAAKHYPKCRTLVADKEHWFYDARTHFRWCMRSTPGEVDNDNNMHVRALNACSH